MKIFDTYKSVNGQRVYTGRALATGIDFVNPNMPALPVGESYLVPVDVTSIETLEDELKATDSRIAGAGDDVDERFMWQSAKVSLLNERRRFVADADSKEGT